jgi:hypothetical protein
MPVVKHVGDLANPEEFHGMNAEDVLRHIKGFEEAATPSVQEQVLGGYDGKVYYSNSM